MEKNTPVSIEKAPVIPLSQIIIQNHDVVTFAELLKTVNQLGEGGMVLMEFDLKPDFPDPPRDWQTQLEVAFMTKASPFSRPPEIIDRPEPDGNED